MKTRVIAWWSGGIASAVACYWAVNMFRNVRVVFLDTYNEHPDTYRFLKDCEEWYKQSITTLSRKEYKNIEEVWRKYLSLNTADGAICSSELKREVRIKFQNLDTDYGQVFGFDSSERKRHEDMKKNYPEINNISPLIEMKYTKERCIDFLQIHGMGIPEMYKLGFRNNNCFKTMCVQGGIGYWQKVKVDFPEKFDKMAALEHELTDKKGKPVTILKDQSKEGKLVFLKPHPSYPDHKDISMMKGRPVEPLLECHGFCHTK